MIVRIQKREKPYVMIDKRPLNDNRLTWKAKGILAYLISKPDNWTVRIQDVINSSPDGRDAVKAGFADLKKHGYASLRKTRNGSEWVIYEEPQTENPAVGGEPQTENPATAFPTVAKPGDGFSGSLEQNEVSNNEVRSKKERTKGKMSRGGFLDSLSIPPKLNTLEFSNAWARWRKHRSQIRKPLTQTSVQAQLNQMQKWGLDKSIRAIDQSIQNGWQGIFEPKGSPQQTKVPPLARTGIGFNREKFLRKANGE